MYMKNAALRGKGRRKRSVISHAMFILLFITGTSTVLSAVEEICETLN